MFVAGGAFMKNSGSMSHKYASLGSKSRSATGYVEQAFQYLLIQVVLGEEFVIHPSQKYIAYNDVFCGYIYL